MNRKCRRHSRVVIRLRPQIFLKQKGDETTTKYTKLLLKTVLIRKEKKFLTLFHFRDILSSLFLNSS